MIKEPYALGPCIGLDPQCHNFRVKFPLPPMRTLKFALPPTPTPKGSMWNIGGIGSPTQNSRVGHVHFMVFVLISFVLGRQRVPSLQWNKCCVDSIRRSIITLLDHFLLGLLIITNMLDPCWHRISPTHTGTLLCLPCVAAAVHTVWCVPATSPFLRRHVYFVCLI